MVGITNYAQNELGDVCLLKHLQLVTSWESKIKSILLNLSKLQSDLHSPVGGEVIDMSNVVVSDTALINISPEDQDWLAKIKISDPEELTFLLTVLILKTIKFIRIIIYFFE
ncbi:unnamed protein product [Absidia cylindrospora]